MNKTKQIVTVAMLSAIAYLISFVKLPVQFLSFEIKDFVICITGFIFGAGYAFIAALISSFAEMITISSTGIIGFVMNLIASAVFACTASLFYRRNRTMPNAVIGLTIGTILTTIVMIIWNLVLTPIYMNVPREVVVGIIVPLLLPFNLIKYIVSSCVTILLYKPIVTALRGIGFAPDSVSNNERKVNLALMIVSVLLIIGGIAILKLAFNVNFTEIFSFLSNKN